MKKYTLIELLVAMGIFAFMMLLLMNFFSISTDLLGRENNRATKLYEASVISSIFQQDLKNLSVNGTDKPFEYDRNGDNTTLRFFTTGYDEGGDHINTSTTTSIMVSYKYNSTNFTLERYVESVDNFIDDDNDPSTTTTNVLSDFYDNVNFKVDDNGKKFADIDTGVNKDKYGGIILEGVETFDVLFYELGNFKTFTATSPDSAKPTYSDVLSTGYTNKFDAMTLQLVLNDTEVTDLIEAGSITSTSNLAIKNRRTITQQFLLGYND